MVKLGELGEFGLIERIRARAGSAAGVCRGIGDDAAELEVPSGQHLLTSTDMLLEGVHFSFDWVSPGDLGRKAVAVNLSDIAAMGGTPRFLYVGLACPPQAEVAALSAFMEGLIEEAGSYGVTLVGGDTCRSPGPWVVSITVEGTVPRGEAVGRDGARCGDAILVSGSLGDSALALALWQRGMVPEPELAIRHCRPTPRVLLGRELASAGVATAMIDLSDGLSSDLEHILQESAAGALIDPRRLPLSPAFRRHCDRQPELLELALAGGEDYELLCTVPAGRVAEALLLSRRCGVALTEIGKVTSRQEGMQQMTSDGGKQPLRVRGYDHFCRSGGDAQR